jgi:hypothetical protein
MIWVIFLHSIIIYLGYILDMGSMSGLLKIL